MCFCAFCICSSTFNHIAAENDHNCDASAVATMASSHHTDSNNCYAQVWTAVWLQCGAVDHHAPYGERTSQEDKWTRMLNYDTNEQRSVPVPLGGLRDPKHDINTRNNRAHNFGTRGRRGTHLGLAPRRRALRGHQRVCQLHMPPVSLWPPYRLCICPIMGGETILWQRMV